MGSWGCFIKLKRSTRGARWEISFFGRRTLRQFLQRFGLNKRRRTESVKTVLLNMNLAAALAVTESIRQSKSHASINWQPMSIAEAVFSNAPVISLVHPVQTATRRRNIFLQAIPIGAGSSFQCATTAELGLHPHLHTTQLPC
jgi:hypothetical protein